MLVDIIHLVLVSFRRDSYSSVCSHLNKTYFDLKRLNTTGEHTKSDKETTINSDARDENIQSSLITGSSLFV